MEAVLLCAMLLGIFAFGFFIVDRFGRFMDNTVRMQQVPPQEKKDRYAAGMNGRNAAAAFEDAGQPLPACGARDQCGVIICNVVDPSIIDYMERSGCVLKYVGRE